MSSSPLCRCRSFRLRHLARGCRPLHPRALFLLAVIAGPAMADTASIGGSHFEMRATEKPGAVAELHFRNMATNGGQDEGAERTLTLGHVSIVITFDWDVSVIGEDAVTITTDDNHFAHPETLTVREMQDGLALIYPLESVGF